MEAAAETPSTVVEASVPLTKKRRASENGVAGSDMKNGSTEKARYIDESYFA